ncbi:RING finger protein 227 [Tiliqua scincoides]|uniref:RING finger protein 227 n=1 Tax=Tiliqua scincoides TaxID=71010 RepID=UPI00346326CD
MVEKREEGGTEELECGICCMPYDRCGRAPRRLGGARGSWKPSRCRHVLCSACVCQLAREGWWEEVTCPYCRAVTSLRERGNFLVAGVRRGSTTLVGGGRRHLVLPPIDAELWQRVVREEERRRDGRADEAEGAGEEQAEEGGDEDREQWRLWTALKRLLKGGAARAQSGGGRRRSSVTAPARRQPVNPYGPEIKDLALVTCYVI